MKLLIYISKIIFLINFLSFIFFALDNFPYKAIELCDFLYVVNENLPNARSMLIYLMHQYQR